MELNRVLDRIKYSQLVHKPDIKTLNDLCIAFVSTIPFETLDIFGGPQRVFTLEDVYDRVINQNRGGYCCELNALMHWLLTELGFEASMCPGYEILSDAIGDEAAHMTLMITLPNNEKSLTDVGWGGTSFAFPLRMDCLETEQSQPNGVYKIKLVDDIYIVEKKKQTQIRIDGKVFQSPSEPEILSKYQTNASWDPLYAFTKKSWQVHDFADGFKYAQEVHPFTTKNSCAVLQDRRGRTFLIGDKLVEKRYIDPMTVKLISIRKCDKVEIKDILEDKFNLSINFQLQPQTNLHWKSA